MKITFESFKDHKGESPSFDNPHGWTLEQLNELYGLLREKLNAAWSIRLMAVSHHLKAGTYEDQIAKLKEV